MPTTITGTDGVSQVQTGAVESGDLASGAIGSGDLPAGSVIQVVQGGYGVNDVRINSTSFVDTGIEATITPQSNASKVIALTTFPFGQDDSNGAAGVAAIFRGDSTNLIQHQFSRDRVDFASIGTAAMTIVDSPSTTIAITYKIKAKTSNLNSDFRVNYNTFDANFSQVSYLTLLEVSG